MNAQILRHSLRSRNANSYRLHLNKRMGDNVKNPAVKRKRHQELCQVRRKACRGQRVLRMSMQENSGVAFFSEDS